MSSSLAIIIIIHILMCSLIPFGLSHLLETSAHASIILYSSQKGGDLINVSSLRGHCEQSCKITNEFLWLADGIISQNVHMIEPAVPCAKPQRGLSIFIS